MAAEKSSCKTRPSSSLVYKINFLHQTTKHSSLGELGVEERRLHSEL